MFTFTIPSESIKYGYAVFQSKGDLRQLNVEVTGSEGEHVFSVRINKGLLKQHKYRRNKESDEDWEKVVQKKSDDIVARLGDIELKETSAGDPDLMTWVHNIDKSRSDVQKTLRESRLQINMYKERCVELEKQNQSLIAEKKRYEKELVIKFSALLNTKKRKMRQFEGDFSDGFGDYIKKEETSFPDSIGITEHLQPSETVIVKEEAVSQGLVDPNPEEPIELDSDATVESD
ncbi:hypothetical protein CKK34_0512 [Yarrowia sp. E02]|nr:hypothetical protein CKK34_0512 [Yarrowia sp. E02]